MTLLTRLSALHLACMEQGTILFTVTELDLKGGVYRRIYSSHPQDYPTGGTKPLDRDAFYDMCIAARRPFVANTPDSFRDYFTDHAKIVAMGLGSAANFPVFGADGAVWLTVNLLAGKDHFSESGLGVYQALIGSSFASDD